MRGSAASSWHGVAAWRAWCLPAWSAWRSVRGRRPARDRWDGAGHHRRLGQIPGGLPAAWPGRGRRPGCGRAPGHYCGAPDDRTPPVCADPGRQAAGPAGPDASWAVVGVAAAGGRWNPPPRQLGRGLSRPPGRPGRFHGHPVIRRVDHRAQRQRRPRARAHPRWRPADLPGEAGWPVTDLDHAQLAGRGPRPIVWPEPRRPSTGGTPGGDRRRKPTPQHVPLTRRLHRARG
jgi:hypothetical protein